MQHRYPLHLGIVESNMQQKHGDEEAPPEVHGVNEAAYHITFSSSVTRGTLHEQKIIDISTTTRALCARFTRDKSRQDTSGEIIKDRSAVCSTLRKASKGKDKASRLSMVAVGMPLSQCLENPRR